MEIQKVSDETREAIARKSARSLPTRPSAAGMKPDEIKKAFYEPIVGAAVSALGEIDRVVDEVNGALEEERQSLVVHEERQDNPHAVTAAQVGLGAVDNTADEDKPVSRPQREAIEARVARKVTGEEEVYLTDAANGAPRGSVGLREAVVGGTIPKRSYEGNIFVGNATSDEHAVNKAVMEAALMLLVEKLVGRSGDQVIDGDLLIIGKLYVQGGTHTTDMDSITVKDAVIVANSDGEVLAGHAGYVICVGGGNAYGILYDPAADCVKIGLGTYGNGVFTYGAGEAQVLATRGEIPHENVPIWDGERRTFIDSGLRKSSLLTKEEINKVYGEIGNLLDEVIEYQERLLTNSEIEAALDEIIALQEDMIGG